MTADVLGDAVARDGGGARASLRAALRAAATAKGARVRRALQLRALLARCRVMSLMKAPFFQTMGKALGLDVDGDGEIDSLDAVKLFASTTFGKFMSGVAQGSREPPLIPARSRPRARKSGARPRCHPEREQARRRCP